MVIQNFISEPTGDKNFSMYRIVASTSPSRIEAHAGFFGSLMKGIFDPYVLCPFDKKLIFKLVTHVSTRDFTVAISMLPILSTDLRGMVSLTFVI